MNRLFSALLLMLALCGVAHAAIDTYEFANDEERQRYRTLVEELRCPKCQNQNIADSDSPIAMDLRAEIFRMLESGQNNEQIVDFLVMRYGDFVLYKPPLTGRTFLLWYGPWILLGVAFIVLLVIVLRRRRQGIKAGSAELSADEEQRLAVLLQQAQAEQASQDKKD